MLFTQGVTIPVACDVITDTTFSSFQKDMNLIIRLPMILKEFHNDNKKRDCQMEVESIAYLQGAKEWKEER